MNSFAKSSLTRAKTRLRKIVTQTIPVAEEELFSTRLSLNLAIKIKLLREWQKQHNPFNNGNLATTSDEETAIFL